MVKAFFFEPIISSVQKGVSNLGLCALVTRRTKREFVQFEMEVTICLKVTSWGICIYSEVMKKAIV